MGFAKDLARFERKVDTVGKDAVRKVSLAVLQGVTFRSPVDTGHFRRNWRVGIGGPEGGVIGSPGDSPGGQDSAGVTAGELSAARARLLSAKWGDTVSVSNPVDYGVYLEAGSSAQTNNVPNGIVGATVDEVEVKFASLLREAGGAG